MAKKRKCTPKTPREVYSHFKMRLHQRYGLVIDVSEWNRLCKTMGSSKFVSRESLTRTWHLLNIQNQQVYACYQQKLGLTTVLTPEQYGISHGTETRRISDDELD